jgi:hypothetical protein
VVKDFYYLAKYQMTVPGAEGAAGAVIIPSGLPSHTLIRRDLDRLLGRRLLDPQVYLSDLQPDRCRNTCTCLASYSWFLADNVPAFDSGQQTQAEWRRAVQNDITAIWRRTPTTAADIRRAVDECISFQVRIGVEAIILPSPLTRDHASDYAREAEWLEIGCERAAALAAGTPAFATIAISDTCLRGFRPRENTLIDIILDQVTARARAGAYVVLEQANETTYNCTSSNTVGSLLRLVSGLKAGGLERVIVCYAGTAGLLALAVGADAWAAGWYRSERRLKPADIEQSEGRAMPAYYSQPAATEFHLVDDLTRVRDAGLFPRIADETVHSAELLRALRAGRSPNDVAPWQPRQSNVTAARAHYVTAMIRETQHIGGLRDPAQQIAYGTDWLQGATEIAAALYQIGEFNQRTELDHQRAWREAFAENLPDA